MTMKVIYIGILSSAHLGLLYSLKGQATMAKKIGTNLALPLNEICERLPDSEIYNSVTNHFSDYIALLKSILIKKYC